jgi:hypothetical protein
VREPLAARTAMPLRHAHSMGRSDSAPTSARGLPDAASDSVRLGFGSSSSGAGRRPRTCRVKKLRAASQRPAPLPQLGCQVLGVGWLIALPEGASFH